MSETIDLYTGKSTWALENWMAGQDDRDVMSGEWDMTGSSWNLPEGNYIAENAADDDAVDDADDGTGLQLVDNNSETHPEQVHDVEILKEGELILRHSVEVKDEQTFVYSISDGKNFDFAAEMSWDGVEFDAIFKWDGETSTTQMTEYGSWNDLE